MKAITVQCGAQGLEFRYADGARYINLGYDGLCVEPARRRSGRADAENACGGAIHQDPHVCVPQALPLQRERTAALSVQAGQKRACSTWPAYVHESGWEFDCDSIGTGLFPEHLEQRIADLAKLGIEADLIVLHPYDRWGFSDMSPAQDDRYLRYLVSRASPPFRMSGGRWPTNTTSWTTSRLPTGTG